MKNSFYNILLKIGEHDVLYNTFSGKFIKLTPDIVQCMDKKDSNSQLEEMLESKSFIVKDDIDEKEMIKSIYMQKRYDSRTYLLTLNTSLDCNLNCWYCYESHLANSYMSADLVQRILSHLELKHKQAPFESLKLSFFGGEPMMNYKAISTLLKGVKEQAMVNKFKVELFFTTNGTFITERYIDILRPFTTRFQITIDGDKESHNSIRKFKNEQNQNCYERILNGLKLLNNADANFYFTLRINYDDKVLNKIDTLIRDLSFLDRKRTVISLQKVWQCGASQIDTTKLFEVIESINNAGFMTSTYQLSRNFSCCYADCFNQAVINYDGKIFKCTARDFTKEASYGYLNSLGLIEWNTELAKKRLSLEIPQKCKSCKLLPCCPGICSQKLIENSDSKEISCPFDKRISHEDIILLNIKQQLIAQKHEKE